MLLNDWVAEMEIGGGIWKDIKSYFSLHLENEFFVL